MTEKEIEKIFNVDESHKLLYSMLGENGQRVVKDIMSVLPAGEFKEVSPTAEFDVGDIPIPLTSLTESKEKSKSSLSMTENLESELESLLVDINTEGKNVEYPYVFCGFIGDEVDYCAGKKMGKGGTQSCSYDWAWIENFIKDPVNCDMNIALFHTHPKPIGKPHNTLFNKYPEILYQKGASPDGLNISVSDVYANAYLDMLIKKHNKSLNAQSLILMHNGEFVSFSTNGGLVLNGIRTIERSKATTKQRDE